MHEDNMGASVPDQALVASDQAASRLAGSRFDPSRYRVERYDGNSTRILCAGGWVAAMIERLANDRWVICVGDQRYTRITFASAKKAFAWWLERQAAIAMDAAKPTRHATGSARKGDSAGPQDIAQTPSEGL